MDLTDTNPENNWCQFYTNYKWIGTKWKAYRLLVLSLDIDFAKLCKVVGAKFRNGLCTVVIHQRKGTGVHECHELLNFFSFFLCYKMECHVWGCSSPVSLFILGCLFFM